jgi:CubicO group peptidase (beta-lactamase class C family)
MKTKNTINVLVILSILLINPCKGQEKIDFNSFIDNTATSISKSGESVFDRMKHYNVPGVSIAVINNGVIDWAKGYGIANIKNETKVNTETLFQAASISKPFTALAVLKLLEEGKIELDEDVNTYLKDWKVPKNKFTEIEKVTLRRLLTHTAGITVHGFPGYRQKKSFPSTLMVLNGKGNTSAITVDTIPGSIWRYSGGGYTIIQKLIEDVSGISFAKYMDKNILEPMGMHNSTFQQPLPSNLHSKASAAYNSKGKMVKGLWHNYPEQAAAGLWTTPTDLAKYCIEIQQILSGKSNGILSKTTIETMLTKHKNNWGLGLFVESEGNYLRFAHGGTNEGFNANLFSFAYQGKAIIVMTNGDNGKKLINEIHRSIFEFYQW